MKVWARIADCLKNGDPCALVTVAGAAGSTPREAGARMVVRADCSFHGTIGGGTLELDAIRRAAAAVRAGVADFRIHAVSLGPDLGQCCGGRVDIAIEVLTAASHAMAERLAEREAGALPFATRAQLTENTLLDRLILDDLPDDIFRLGNEHGAGGQLLEERFGDMRRPLYLFGAGHVGKALVLALAPHPFEITWIDNRVDQFPAMVPANVRMIHSSDPGQELQSAPDGAFVLAMTHSHALDEEIMARALLGQRFGYCGVIGSKTKRARFRNRLKARGLGEGLISEMVCPVGVTAIRSKQPAAIAAGIVVDLLQRDEAQNRRALAGEGVAQIIPHGQ